jgi:type IV pilus assembly protein PilN
MIRINLLGVDRQKSRRAPVFDIGKRITMACSLILVLAVLGIGYWYFSLSQASRRVDADIVTAQQEAARLQSLLAEVTRFEEQRKQLQARVQLIEELRKGQSVPVQLLDHISKSLPEMLWLTQMRQEGPEVTIEGRSTTLLSLSDFVGNLGSNDFFKKPIEIIDSQVDAAAAAGRPAGTTVEVIRFTVKAQLTNAPAASAPPARR